jgi:hypothetical protein
VAQEEGKMLGHSKLPVGVDFQGPGKLVSKSFAEDFLHWHLISLAPGHLSEKVRLREIEKETERMRVRR